MKVAATPVTATDSAQRALDAADPWSIEGFRRLIRDTAGRGHPFTAAVVMAAYGQPPERPCQVGAAFMAESRAGTIRCVGAVPSPVKSRSGGLIRVWRAGPALDAEGAAA